MPRLALSLALLLGVTLCSLATPAAEPAADQAESDETRRLIAAELPNWKFFVGRGPERPLKLQPQSALRWSNPGTGRVFGDVYVWTDRGRPEVVMSLFKAWQPANGFHVELHSLTGEALAAEREEKPIWHPARPGITLADVPDAEAPADTPARRLAQMKAIAREFSINLRDRRVNDSGENQALRLLNQPLYRYEPEAKELTDGALFAFALGTDPELFLVLEASGGRWQYGVARMNDGAMSVLYRGQVVQSFDRAADRDHERDPYVLKRVPETPRP